MHLLLVRRWCSVGSGLVAACGVNGGGYGCGDVVDRGSVSAAVLLQVFNSFQAS
jgi:hypothetical protein